MKPQYYDFYKAIYDKKRDFRSAKSQREGKLAIASKKVKPRSQYVYLMKQTKSPYHFKIGLSNNPYRRREEVSMQFNQPIKLLVYWTVRDMNRAEKCLHSYYKEAQVFGEWFEFRRAPVGEITQLLKRQKLLANSSPCATAGNAIKGAIGKLLDYLRNRRRRC